MGVFWDWHQNQMLSNQRLLVRLFEGDAVVISIALADTLQLKTLFIVNNRCVLQTSLDFWRRTKRKYKILDRSRSALKKMKFEYFYWSIQFTCLALAWAWTLLLQRLRIESRLVLFPLTSLLFIVIFHLSPPIVVRYCIPR